MELVRLSVIYIHLLACCVAIGLVFASDAEMVKNLLKGHSKAGHDAEHMASLQKSVANALIFLWLTGAAVIGIDYLEKGMNYFANPKLQAKIIIVLLLTFNGMLLHRYVLPALLKAGSLLKLNIGVRMFALFSGALSGVSWLYAAMLGVGRPLAWKYSLTELLLAYPVMILLGFALMAALTQWARKRSQGEAVQAPVWHLAGIPT
ncbi:hypothetical protein DV532_14505 [Pseudomonas sp. Leaf58]|uniref:hypothetical protein n=1 Tax=Pseudomonas sp. Leaf58 TaxID=1736226 RepID=UPI000701C581|nr:hypothetical protein [Pseudomonas sp. Leaf58]AYG45436.1 hypothetical protein DV532_14505 [Pseudomonas sp. Leaf58]KQN58683.1 hypothetical protein ASF02_17505 [Pseudomonas sp. Leaf58]